MFCVNERIRIPTNEFSWQFVRSSGPGGQNVNKVASKAVLRWDLAASPSLPDDVKSRLRTELHRRITGTGELILASQRYRDQDRNRQDCLEKLRAFVLVAAERPRPRHKTKPTRGAHERRLQAKRHRAHTKRDRRHPNVD